MNRARVEEMFVLTKRGNQDQLKLLVSTVGERPIGHVVLISQDERARRSFVNGLGWCDVLVRVQGIRQVKRMHTILKWVTERRDDLVFRLNRDAWDFISILVEERGFRERPLERLIQKDVYKIGTD